MSFYIVMRRQADYIAATIASVVAQVMQPDEIIVSNDCSTDSTMAVLQRLEMEIPILKVIDQPKNLGMSRNTDFVLRAAKGEIIIKLDSDDL
ncbi:MAG: glycosyltransferase family 2 protein, partial [Alcaligenaceae bacterium]